MVNRNIHRKTTVLESLFNEVAGMNFFKKRLQQRCFPKNIQDYKNSFFYRTLPVAASKWENGKIANLENSVNVQKQPPEMLYKQI